MRNGRSELEVWIDLRADCCGLYRDGRRSECFVGSKNLLFRKVGVSTDQFGDCFPDYSANEA